MSANEILEQYTKGEITLEEANEQLSTLKCPLRLDPMKNAITGAEMAATKSDGTPEGTSGWGMMNHGVGTPEKMKVTAGKLEYDTGFGGTGPRATLTIAGHVFNVVGDRIEAKK